MADLIPRIDLTFRTPLLNAAGMLGFSPDPNGPVALDRLGAFITNPISLRPRTPAAGTRLLHFPGGVLLHTGHPNAGLSAVLRQEAARWHRAPLPVIVHLLADEPGAVQAAVLRLEEEEGVAGIELGLPPAAGPRLSTELLDAAMGELPIIVQVPLDRGTELAGPLAAAGAQLCSLGPPRGTLPGPSGEAISGRLYGPALLPLAFRGAQQLLRAGVRVIGGGGIYRAGDAHAFLALGVEAVQLDTVLWKDPGFVETYSGADRPEAPRG